MSYKINGHEITVNFPVDSISVNKTSIAFTDRQGKTDRLFKAYRSHQLYEMVIVRKQISQKIN